MKAVGSRIEELHQVPGAIHDHEKSALVITLDDRLMPIGSMSHFVVTNYPELRAIIKSARSNYSSFYDTDDSIIKAIRVCGPYCNKYAAVYAVILYRSTSPHAERNSDLIRGVLDALHKNIQYDKLSRVIMPRIGAECGLNWLRIIKPQVEEIFADMNVSVSY